MFDGAQHGRPYLFAKAHALYSRFATAEVLQSCLTNRNILPALAAFHGEESAALLTGQGGQPTEFDLHRLYIKRILAAVPRANSSYPMITALAREYEIRNVSLFLKCGAAADSRNTAQDRAYFTDDARAQYWYTLPNEGGAAFGHKTFALDRETVMRMLLKSPYAAAARKWEETHDTVVLDATLENLYCQMVEKMIKTIPGNDKSAVRKLYVQRLSLRMTLEALRMQRTCNMDTEEILALLYLPSAVLRDEIIGIMATQRFTSIPDALPLWARAWAGNVLAEHPDLKTEAADPELSPADISRLEKFAAIILLQIYRHAFACYGNSSAPIYSFYHLLKRELQNIILLVNGIRFGVEPEVFKAELVT
jgi:vacuolar-type H+-ATPase subunit C/Vma6